MVPVDGLDEAVGVLVHGVPSSLLDAVRMVERARLAGRDLEVERFSARLGGDLMEWYGDELVRHEVRTALAMVRAWSTVDDGELAAIAAEGSVEVGAPRWFLVALGPGCGPGTLLERPAGGDQVALVALLEQVLLASSHGQHQVCLVNGSMLRALSIRLGARGASVLTTELDERPSLEVVETTGVLYRPDDPGAASTLEEALDLARALGRVQG